MGARKLMLRSTEETIIPSVVESESAEEVKGLTRAREVRDQAQQVAYSKWLTASAQMDCITEAVANRC